MICQGWVFIDDGARLATSMTVSITARGTCCFLETPRAAARLHQLLEVDPASSPCPWRPS